MTDKRKGGGREGEEGRPRGSTTMAVVAKTRGRGEEAERREDEKSDSGQGS